MGRAELIKLVMDHKRCGIAEAMRTVDECLGVTFLCRKTSPENATGTLRYEGRVVSVTVEKVR